MSWAGIEDFPRLPQICFPLRIAKRSMQFITPLGGCEAKTYRLPRSCTDLKGRPITSATPLTSLP